MYNIQIVLLLYIWHNLYAHIPSGCMYVIIICWPIVNIHGSITLYKNIYVIYYFSLWGSANLHLHLYRYKLHFNGLVPVPVY